jgi:REP element-mobilizing transposase RayT
MSEAYKIKDQNGIYYLTLEIVNWIDIFTRKVYRDILIDSFKYSIENKQFDIFAFVIMSNHVHLLCRSYHDDLSGTLRDIKSFTSKKFLTYIQEENESRRNWMLNLFEFEAKKHKRNTKYQVWTHSNHAEYIFSNKFIRQKLDYIHNNPVKAGIVEHAEDYLYSSARNYAGLDHLLTIELLSLPWITVK